MLISENARLPSYFSICIPQYNRTDFLIEACRAYEKQTFKDFEICISDDCSTDGKAEALRTYLNSTGMRYTYAGAARNLRYDGNLRAAIGLSSGRYLLLMGNDDKLSAASTLEELHGELEKAGDVAAAITNYRELLTGVTFRRMSQTKVLGSGPETAIGMFRSYSFVSGVILHGDKARALSTADLDGSEMYQMYLGARLVACGGRFLAIDRVCVDKDVQIAGQAVDSYARRPRVWPCPIIKRRLPMGRLLEVVGAGLGPCVSKTERDKLLFRVARDLYLFTYPFWGIEYRRVQSWRYALGVLMALEPGEITRPVAMSSFRRTLLWPIYIATCGIALLMPISFFDVGRPLFYWIAKRAR